MFSFQGGLFFNQNASKSGFDYSFAQPNLSYAASERSNAPVTIGVGGSMARFTTIDDRLYILSDFLLETVDISIGKDPKPMGNIPISFTAEHISTTAHIQSCDPVISDGEYAYVTLRGGTPCGGATNQLEAYNIKDPIKPQLIQEFAMDNPHGLTKVGDFLYVCEGTGGWKKIKSNLPGAFKTEQTNKNHSAYDVLLTAQNTLLFVGSSGIYQYELNGNDPKLISEIEFELP
jgi:hypothetical protein